MRNKTVRRKYKYINHTKPVTPPYKILIDTVIQEKDIEIIFHTEKDIEQLKNLIDRTLALEGCTKIMLLKNGWNIYQKERKENE